MWLLCPALEKTHDDYLDQVDRSAACGATSPRGFMKRSAEVISRVRCDELIFKDMWCGVWLHSTVLCVPGCCYGSGNDGSRKKRVSCLQRREETNAGQAELNWLVAHNSLVAMETHELGTSWSIMRSDVNGSDAKNVALWPTQQLSTYPAVWKWNWPEKNGCHVQ